MKRWLFFPESITIFASINDPGILIGNGPFELTASSNGTNFQWSVNSPDVTLINSTSSSLEFTTNGSVNAVFTLNVNNGEVTTSLNVQVFSGGNLAFLIAAL